VMRPVELTRSGLFTEDVFARHCDAWLLPLLEGTVRPADPGRGPLRQAAHPRGYIQLFTCQRELHAATGAKCRVGHGSEIPAPVNTLP
jgi:hypothetical protein